ncbi:MAG: helix-turn-helix transcriptional regulator [Saprospiraceae bacterium]|nr:helix-turn-helix transcriptional regulator [Saprospiraceae bacterium]
MSIFTTPLQIGYFVGILFAILFWYRSYVEERHSDMFLGFVVFFLAMTLQDYTFGFAGINFLWEEMNGFPRYFALALAPTVWFYLRTQINRRFRFRRKDLKHYIPYFLYFLFNIGIFLSGKDVVYRFQQAEYALVFDIIERFAIWASYIYYFYHSLSLYKSYRFWAENQFSNQDKISFIWLRNFIYFIIAGEIFKWIWYIADYMLHMNYEDDWWWQLLSVAITLYVGIIGYAQPQPSNLTFDMEELLKESASNDGKKNDGLFNNDLPVLSMLQSGQEVDYTELEQKLRTLMTTQKPYLDPELSLIELAKKLKTNTTILSGVINKQFGKNFNDFINEYRVNEFIKLSKSKDYKNLTILAIAYDCGFNSKATFNRSVKKLRKVSPRELMKI